MALLPLQAVKPAGEVTDYVAATAGGDTLQPGDNVVLRVKAGATPVTVTIASYRPCDQGGTHNAGGVVAANTEQEFGPLPGNRFANPTTGLVDVTYNQVATITVAAVGR